MYRISHSKNDLGNKGLLACAAGDLTNKLHHTLLIDLVRDPPKPIRYRFGKMERLAESFYLTASSPLHEY